MLSPKNVFKWQFFFIPKLSLTNIKCCNIIIYCYSCKKAYVHVVLLLLFQSNKVPVVQPSHAVHPLTPLITYSDEHFAPGAHPSHIPSDVCSKQGMNCNSKYKKMLSCILLEEGVLFFFSCWVLSEMWNFCLHVKVIGNQCVAIPFMLLDPLVCSLWAVTKPLLLQELSHPE